MVPGRWGEADMHQDHDSCGSSGLSEAGPGDIIAGGLSTTATAEENIMRLESILAGVPAQFVDDIFD